MLRKIRLRNSCRRRSPVAPVARIGAEMGSAAVFGVLAIRKNSDAGAGAQFHYCCEQRNHDYHCEGT